MTKMLLLKKTKFTAAALVLCVSALSAPNSQANEVGGALLGLFAGVIIGTMAQPTYNNYRQPQQIQYMPQQQMYVQQQQAGYVQQQPVYVQPQNTYPQYQGYQQQNYYR